MIVTVAEPSFSAAPGSSRFVPVRSTVALACTAGIGQSSFGVTLNAGPVGLAPPAVVETIAGPPAVVAPAPIVPLSCVAETRWRSPRATPPTVAVAVPSNPAPAIVTSVPTGPLVGLIESDFGTIVTGLEVEPPAFFTVIPPVTAPAGTTAVSDVGLTTLNDVALIGAEKPANVTAVVPVNVLPVRLTVAPDVKGPPLTGSIVGRISRFEGVVNEPAVAPELIETVSLLLTASGTSNRSFLSVELTVSIVTGAVPSFSVPNESSSLFRFVPSSSTVSPTCTGASGHGVMFGVTLNVAALVAVPPSFVTVTGRPLNAPAGTGTLICVAVGVPIEVVETPPIVTSEIPAKRVPVIVTCAPTAPLVGVKLVIVGTVNGTWTAKFCVRQLKPGAPEAKLFESQTCPVEPEESAAGSGDADAPPQSQVVSQPPTGSVEATTLNG